MPIFPSLKDTIGKIINEQPYVKLLSIPKCDTEGNWTVLAQVNDSLCLIQVKVVIINE